MFLHLQLPIYHTWQSCGHAGVKPKHEGKESWSSGARSNARDINAQKHN